MRRTGLSIMGGLTCTAISISFGEQHGNDDRTASEGFSQCSPSDDHGDVSLDEVEAALLTHPEPVVTVSDLTDELDCSDRHMLTLLRSLEYAGTVQSKQTGARAIAWWHTARVRSPLPTSV
jgi:hypothetical protein